MLSRNQVKPITEEGNISQTILARVNEAFINSCQYCLRDITRKGQDVNSKIFKIQDTAGEILKLHDFAREEILLRNEDVANARPCWPNVQIS